MALIWQYKPMTSKQILHVDFAVVPQERIDVTLRAAVAEDEYLNKDHIESIINGIVKDRDLIKLVSLDKYDTALKFSLKYSVGKNTQLAFNNILDGLSKHYAIIKQDLNAVQQPVIRPINRLSPWVNRITHDAEPLDNNLGYGPKPSRN